MWTRQRAELRTVGPGDGPAIARALDDRLRRVPPRIREALVARWHGAQGDAEGLMLTGRAPAFLFFRRYGDAKARVLGLLGPPEQLRPLLDLALPWLQGRVAAVLAEAESWWRAFGLQDHLEPTWRRHGFERWPVEVLETTLPVGRPPSSPPAGYRLTGWSPGDLPDAAALMASTPDPLQQRVPTPPAECLALLTRSADLTRGVLARAGDRLAGLLSVGPDGDIGQVYVAAPDQGRGLGGALLDAALVRLAAQGQERVRLTMVAGNARAWALYDSRGFRAAMSYPCRVWSA